MFVCCECCMLSGRGLCDELITRPEESYRMWCVVGCDLKNLVNEEAMTHWGLLRQNKKKLAHIRFFTFSPGNKEHECSLCKASKIFLFIQTEQTWDSLRVCYFEILQEIIWCFPGIVAQTNFILGSFLKSHHIFHHF
jgi:hypothetical protein